MYRRLLLLLPASHPEVRLFLDPDQPESRRWAGGDEYSTNLGHLSIQTQRWKQTPPSSSIITPSPLHSSLKLHRHLVGFRSYEDLGERVGPGAADVALGGVERHVVDRLLKLLAVGGELLDARFTLHVPQTDGAVVTWEGGERR